jgi:PAS domain S-box-containing protein
VAASDIGDRVRLEQALAENRRSEQRFQQVFEASADWFWEADAKGCLTYLSPNYEALHGQRIADLLGKRLGDLPGVTVAPDVAETARAAIKERRPFYDYVYSQQLRPEDGKRWIHTNSIPVFDGAGELRGFRGASRDVTARIEAEQALRDSERRFRRLFEINSDWYWESDTKQRITFVSPTSTVDATFGQPFSQFIGKRMSEILAVTFEPVMGLKGLLATKERRPYRDVVYSVTRPDGGVRWVSGSGAPRFGADGEFLGFHGTAVDVTAGKDAEVAAQVAQGHLHAAVAHVTQPFVVYDAEDRVAAFNQAFVDLFRRETRHSPVNEGVSVHDLAKWQAETGFHADGPEDRPIDAATLVAHHQSDAEHTYHLRDGRWMLVIHHRLPGGGRVGVWTDVTQIKRAEAERRSLEEQLNQAQRLEALGTLAGGVAHELNNALVPVIGLTQLVARRLPDSSSDRRNLDTVIGAAKRSRELVNQILAFSRKEGELRRDSVDLGQVLHNALGVMRGTFPAGIRVEEAIAPTPPLEADPAQLEQVIVNLVTNAAQAIGEAAGTIAVMLEPMADGAQLRLSVSDTGCGMDEATKARIFEPFFTTREVGKGTGLGLAVVHGIIKGHGGRIEVESAPGEGARFDVILPVHPAAAA